MASEFIVFAREDRHHQTLGRYHEDSLVPQADGGREVNTAPKTTPRKRRVAPDKAKSAKKATPAKGRTQSQKGAKRAKPAGAQEGSKAAKVLDILKRPKGATFKELMKVTGWQAHSVRGLLSAGSGKKMGLALASAKDEGGERTYSVKH